MAKKINKEWVSPNFSAYITEMQSKFKEQTGKKLSRSDITEIVASFRPIIIVPKEKKKRDGSIFDF